MAFKFDELLEQGKGAAENVLKNKKQIREVLDDLEVSLSRFLEMPVKFKEYTGYAKGDEDPFIRMANSLKPKEKTGYNEVHIVHQQTGASKEVFQLKRSDDIYPITVVRERNHSVADDQNEFASAIGQIISNSQFHLQLKSFKRGVEEKLKEKPQDVPKSE
jgi:hypothetical protein